MNDLDRYFARIGYSGRPAADFGTLERLHLLHALAIPFENLSTLIGEPVPIDIDSLEDKLIDRRRGGYCFEQNTLFAAVLERIGFKVTPLAARVVWNAERASGNPRTHMVLLVNVGEEPFVCDVGFGGVTLTAPLRFETGIEQNTPHDVFRLVATGPEYELRVLWDGQWRPVYRFDLQAQLPIDYVALNHYVSTHPDSRFLTTLIAGLPVEGGRYALVNNEFLALDRGQVSERRVLESADELAEVLTGKFGINLPDDERLRAALSRISGRK